MVIPWTKGGKNSLLKEKNEFDPMSEKGGKKKGVTG